MRFPIIICFNLLFLFLHVQLKPLQEKGLCGEKGNRLRNKERKRFRRSIPDFDAVNPTYADSEELPDQDEAADEGMKKVESPFTLSEHFSNFFRGQKASKPAQKAPGRPTPGERSLNVARSVDFPAGQSLPLDEQEECYKQQNIEPLGRGAPSKRWSKGISQELPVIGAGQKGKSSYVRSNLLRERGGKRFEENEGEKMELTSLYSNAEKVFRPKKIKHYPEPKRPDIFNTDGRVYKPINVEAKFPVYDEDLDFHPDPLQGILDDKYWLDPQEQESVVRKYYDMASNIIPPRIETAKRSAGKSHQKVKSVNSKAGFKESSANERCPCKEVVACGECSKGKGVKKTNSSVLDEDDGVSYGRKLLSLSFGNEIDKELGKHASYNTRKILSLEYDNNEIPGEGCNEETQIHEDLLNYTLNTYGKKLISFVDNDIGNKEEDLNEDSYVEVNSFRIGRKLLWLEENDDYYADIDDDNQDYPNTNNKNFIDEVPNSNDNLHGLKTAPHVQYISDRVRDNTLETNKQTGPYRQKIVGHMVVENVHEFSKPPGYFKPNKIANVLQKPFQEKPKGPPKKLKINATREFEALQNETFKIASSDQVTNGSEQNNMTSNPTTVTVEPYSTNQATNVLSQKKAYNKRGSERLSFKGRRRYAESPLMKRLPVAPLFQSVEDAAASGSKDMSKTANSKIAQSTTTVYSSATTTQTEPTCDTSLFSESLPTTPTVCSSLELNCSISCQSTEQTTEKDKSNLEDEDHVDAEVANDIVDTVLSESQKSSVLGHNLGLCRQNESLVNVKYGKIVPETAKVLKSVVDCIMERLKNHLAKQSCILLDPELLDFLKWMIFTGESYKDYMQKMAKFYDFLPTPVPSYTTCPPLSTTLPPCDPDLAFNPQTPFAASPTPVFF